MERNVYDHVWVMIQGKPAHMVIYAVVREMALMKGGMVELFYHVVRDQTGASMTNSYRCEPRTLFDTKEALLAAFVSEHSK